MSVLLDMIKEHVTDCCGVANVEPPDDLVKLVLNLEARAIGAGIVEASLSHVGSAGRPVNVKVFVAGQKTADIKAGIFVEWGLDYAEFESAAASYTVGIVELPDGSIITKSPEMINFTDVDP